MNARQRFHAALNFQPFDRLPMIEWATWWNLTINRWHSEGMPAEVRTDEEVMRYFDLDVMRQDWIRIRKRTCPVEPSHGAGIIATAEDYERIREHLYPVPAVDKERWRRWAADREKGDIVLWFTLDGFFWFPRILLGIERHLYAFYDNAELMHRINTDLLNWQLQVIDELSSICIPDFMTFAEDMSYNHGPMLSKKLFDEFMLPYYRQVVPRLKELGVTTIIDSDGDVTRPAYWFEEAGLDGILPLERQAGVDMARLRAEHPRMRFIGHYDKMVMNQGEAAMRGEFERLLPIAAQGGFLISVDHQTPPGVSIDDYRIYLRLFREYAERAGELSQTLLARSAA
ncbi:MAG: Uroporphyrinogen decarboxylase (URO-D) [Chloroflexi bacterium ADurb.Bin325]|nr:MAG: Uroporphyrinogen decarboxylase (URO-D) [Chloroflexi bacterium ADurb.Bin325]